MYCNLTYLCIKIFKEEFTNPLPQIHLIDDEYGVVLKLVLFASNIKKEI
jgi:hypothetical protein